MKGIEPLVFFSAPFYDLGKLKLNTFFELNPWLKPRQTKGQHTLNAHGQLKLTTYLFLSQNRNCLCIWSSFLQHRCWIVQSWHLCCLLPFKFIMGPTSTKHTIPSPITSCNLLSSNIEEICLELESNKIQKLFHEKNWKQMKNLFNYEKQECSFSRWFNEIFNALFW